MRCSSPFVVLVAIAASGCGSDTPLSLATNHDSARAEQLGGSVYLIGGSSDGVSEVAPILASSELGAFNRAGATLTSGFGGFASFVAGERLWLLGGADQTGYLATVKSAELTNGVLASFADSTLTLESPRASHGSFAISDRIYLVGGMQQNTASLSTVETATVTAEGALGDFARVVDVNLTTGRHSFVTAVIGNYVYVIGGDADGIDERDDVERATITSEGALVGFEPVLGVHLNVPRAGATALITPERLYVIGGLDSNERALDSVEVASITTGGELGTFQIVNGVSLAEARAFHAAILVGDDYYVLGGSDLLGKGEILTYERAHLAGGVLGDFNTVVD